MKRFFILIILVFSLAGLACAQNANRSGFLVEVGIGGMVGDTPRSSILVTNNVMQYKCASGAAVDLGLGFRFRFKSHWAYELKVEGQTALSAPMHTLTGRFLPLGFRYTSVEVWRNYSLFVHFNIGGAVAMNRGVIRYLNNETFYPNTPDRPIKGYAGEEGYGPAYSLGLGANVTTHFYAEACWNGQVIFDGYRKNGKDMLNDGIVAFILGYRF
ncbi:MAG: hypothetical protein K2J58_03635 [Muribaculaceae bacterium]|nr:hypothetical protein [Muribaculaceae bacterium]